VGGTVGPVIDQSASRALAALAHGAIAFGFFGIGFIASLAIAGIIWLYSKRSPEVRFHSEQAGCYQCSVLLINAVFLIVLGTVGGFSIFNLFQGRDDWGLSWGVGLGLILFAFWFVASILYGIFAAIMVLMGKRFKYPIIGDRFEKKAL
jgi:uncharacterized membrane protein